MIELTPDSPTRQWTNARVVGLIVVVCVICTVSLFGVIAGHVSDLSIGAAKVERFLGAVSASGPGGVVVVMMFMVLVASIGFLPASLIGVASGAIYGLVDGFVVAACAVLLGAMLTFAASRSLFRGTFERLIARRQGMRRVSEELVKERWRLVCLLRMSPVMPFALTSYALGLSSIRLRDYMVGTLASVPALFGYVCIGWLARDSIQPGGLAGYLQWLIVGIGVAATFLLTFYIKRVVSRAIGGCGST